MFNFLQRRIKCLRDFFSRIIVICQLLFKTFLNYFCFRNKVKKKTVWDLISNHSLRSHALYCSRSNLPVVQLRALCSSYNLNVGQKKENKEAIKTHQRNKRGHQSALVLWVLCTVLLCINLLNQL